MFSLRNLFHVSFLAKLITVVWLLYTSSPHPKHFALHIAYTCQHSYFPVKVQLTLKDCLKPTLMCFIKWNLGCGGRSPGRSSLTSETSVTSSWSCNKQIGGLLCSRKLRVAHFSKSMLQGVYTRKPHTQESWPPSGFSFAEWEEVRAIRGCFTKCFSCCLTSFSSPLFEHQPVVWTTWEL